MKPTGNMASLSPQNGKPAAQCVFDQLDLLMVAKAIWV